MIKKRKENSELRPTSNERTRKTMMTYVGRNLVLILVHRDDL